MKSEVGERRKSRGEGRGHMWKVRVSELDLMWRRGVRSEPHG